MNSDHANDQKALARMVADLKRELADATIKARQTDKFLTYICEANEGKAGGVEAWNLLAEGRHGMSEIQQRSIIKFGKDAYNRPSVDVRDALGIDIFAWVGSPTHAHHGLPHAQGFKLRNQAMSEYCATNDRPPPATRSIAESPG